MEESEPLLPPAGELVVAGLSVLLLVLLIALVVLVVRRARRR